MKSIPLKQSQARDPLDQIQNKGELEYNRAYFKKQKEYASNVNSKISTAKVSQVPNTQQLYEKSK